jgi:hypothetical protein
MKFGWFQTVRRKTFRVNYLAWYMAKNFEFFGGEPQVVAETAQAKRENRIVCDVAHQFFCERPNHPLAGESADLRVVQYHKVILD